LWQSSCIRLLSAGEGSTVEGGSKVVLRTIEIGSCTLVQGMVVKQLDNGKVVIAVGSRTYEGVPVGK
jgi:hypothetical protein